MNAGCLSVLIHFCILKFFTDRGDLSEMVDHFETDCYFYSGWNIAFWRQQTHTLVDGS